MPNQLSQFRKRTSLAEHESVLAALRELAREDGVTVAELFREAARDLVARRARDHSVAHRLRQVVMAHAPAPPKVFKSAAQVSRFKRDQREFDELVQRLNLVDSTEIQKRNSLFSGRPRLRLVGGR